MASHLVAHVASHRPTHGKIDLRAATLRSQGHSVSHLQGRTRDPIIGTFVVPSHSDQPGGGWSMAKNSRRVAVGRMTMTTGLGLRLWGSQLAWVSNAPSKSTTSAQAGGGSPNGDETGQKPGRRTPRNLGWDSDPTFTVCSNRHGGLAPI